MTNSRVLVTALIAATGIVACGNGDTSTSQPPLALTAHVLEPTALSGFKRAGAVTREDPAAFGKIHHKTTAELTKTGFVAGVTERFAGPDPSNAMSIAAQFGSPAQARVEMARLLKENAEPEPGATVERAAVTGIPGGQALQQRGKVDGADFVGVEVIFTEGAVVHDVFVIGTKGKVSVPAVLDAARALHHTVAGHPLT